MVFYSSLQENVRLHRQSGLDPEQREDRIQEIEQQKHFDKTVQPAEMLLCTDAELRRLRRWRWRRF